MPYVLTHDEVYYKQRYDLSKCRFRASGAGLVCARRGAGAGKIRKEEVLFRKKEPKNFWLLRALAIAVAGTAVSKRFLLLFFKKEALSLLIKNGGLLEMPDSIIPILEAMRSSHQAHLERLLAWKDAGGKLPVYPNCETIDDFINRERLAVSRFAMSIEHLREHEPQHF